MGHTSSNRKIGVLPILLLLGGLAGCATEVPPCTDCQGPVRTRGAYFPTLDVTDLNRAKRVLPQDLRSPRTLVFVAFTADDQLAISRWIQALRLTPGSSIPWSGIAVIPPRYEIFSGAIENRFRQAFPNPQDRARLFSIDDAQPLIDGLQLRRTNEFVLVITTRDGDVILKERGEPTAEKVRQVQAALSL